uniref:Periviscerokinin n=2 Tax=Ixodidae TaxID=6939 RepID=PVK_RHIMP|nr:RecName: Full=Periviscerokinin [Ixodes ricinus]P85044.1 RecName: Full=Periviscerokinin [Rhipicephalus microplus]
PALIPFPRV